MIGASVVSRRRLRWPRKDGYVRRRVRWPAARRVTTMIRTSAVAAAMTTKASMMPWVVAPLRTTLPRTDAPRGMAFDGVARARGDARIGLKPLHDLQSPTLQVLADQVGGDLAAHAHEGGDERLPISPPIRRAIWIAAPKVSASCGRRCRTAEEDDARQGEALADRLQQLRGQELVRAPDGRHGVRHHQAGECDEDEADGGDEPRIDPAQHEAGQRADDELGRGDPDQGLADLQGAEAAHDAAETAGSDRRWTGWSGAGRRSGPAAAAAAPRTATLRLTDGLRRAAPRGRRRRSPGARPPATGPRPGPSSASRAGCPGRGRRRSAPVRCRRRRGRNSPASGGCGLTGSGGVPKRRHNAMPSASGTFCQKIQRQERWSTYQPSSEAEMFSESSRFSA